MEKPFFALFTLLAGIMIAALPANGLSQSDQRMTQSGQNRESLSIELEDALLSQVLEELERLSGYPFIYTESATQSIRVQELSFAESSLREILDFLEREYPVQFLVMDRKVSVKILREQQTLPASGTGNPTEATSLVQISSSVVDAVTGEPLIGAAVQAGRSTQGVSTDEEGKFHIEAELNDTLLISYIGYIPRKVPVSLDFPTEISLQPDWQELDEMVVVGYGTQKRSHLTGAVGSVQMDETLNRLPVADFGQAMYGQVAGLEIKNASGRPGESSRLQIRGINTLNAGAEPLLVVDGVPLPTYDLSTINTSDIKSVDILKDAASASIYGSRGANGVVLITTKRGASEQSRLTVDYGFTSQTQMRYLDMMDSRQYARAAIDAAQNAWVAQGGDPAAPNTVEARGDYKYTWPAILETPELLSNTDWQKVVNRNAPMHKINVSYAGGAGKSQYRISGGALNQEGIFLGSGYNRYTVNMAADNQVTNWLSIGGMANFSYHDESVPDVSAVQNATEYPPIYPVYSEGGYYGGAESIDGFENYADVLDRSENHPLSRLDARGPKNYERFDIVGNLYAEISIWEQLKFRSALNVAYRRNDERERRSRNIGLPYEQQARQTSTMDRWTNYTSENLLTYQHAWNGHEIDAVAGYEFTHRDHYGLFGEYRDYDNDLFPYLAAGNTIQSLGDAAAASTLVSLLTRVNYNYLGKYMISASFRRDGSSRFGPAKKWGSFPSVSAGWRISEESFFNSGFVNNLMLRASYGYTGNENIGDYRWITSMSMIQVAFGDQLTPSYYPSSVENPDLAWERIRQINTGLNLGLLDDRFTLEADVFQTASDGLLLEVPVPTVSGFPFVFQNIGKIRSNGLELKLTSRNVSSRTLYWETGLTFSRSRSKILEMGRDGAPTILVRNNMEVINQVGETPFSFYGYDYEGVYMNQAEIDAHGVEYPFEVHPGDGRYSDVNGDGVINADDRTIVGNAEPDFIWGINNTVRFKKFDLSFQIGGVVGGNIYNAHRRRSIFYHGGRNYFAALEDRWRSEAEPGNGYYYRLNVDTDGFEREPSSYWLESGTYVRLRNVSLGYQLPEAWLAATSIASARIYVVGANLLNYQKGKFLRDPEHAYGNLADPAVRGVQFGGYPTARTFTIGINVQL